MTELEQIAESVAKALGLKRGEFNKFWLDADARTLFYDGFNLFDPYWQIRCRDWLLEHSHTVHFGWGGAKGERHYLDFPVTFSSRCPPSEFCARAIHELMKGQ